MVWPLKGQMMSRAKLSRIAGVCLLFASLPGSGARGEQVAQGQLPATLEYIARGYETNAQSVGPIRIQGRTLLAQWAREGTEIPYNEVFSPTWLDFEYIERDGKQRYELRNPSLASEYHYALDNNKRLLTFSPNIVSVYPLTDEEERWPHLMHRYGEFLEVSGASGYETVSCAMHTLLKYIETGRFDGEKWKISIDVAPEGPFTIRLQRSIVAEEYVIDSRKGFNLVKAEYLEPSKKRWREVHGDYEYKQLENGSWVRSAATIKGRSGDVLYERRLESTKIEPGFRAPDEMFEEESLNIPAETYRVDHSFSPPLELYKGSGAGLNMADALMDTAIGKTEIAEVSGDGNVAVATHDAYVAHLEHEKGKTAGQAPLAASNRAFPPALLVVIAVAAVIIVLLAALTYAKANHKRRPL
jgi:hypothetical protein